MNETLPMPVDVKLMNLTATVLFTGLAAAALGMLLWWAVRHPLFAIGGITVQGDLTHNNAVTLRANVAPKLDGSFFTVDLAKTRNAFEAVPWVRRALVRREFPNRLKVTLQEHQVAALWGGEGELRLLSTLGEVFEANLGEVEQDDLPRLAGPEGQAPQVLAMFRALAPLFEPLDQTLDQLELTSRGGWRARTDTGAVIELGSGTMQELTVRTERFVRTLTQVASRHNRSADALEAADLRYGEGYALRLRGVTTLVAQPKK